jgi:hypothetical protein
MMFIFNVVFFNQYEISVSYFIILRIEQSFFIYWVDEKRWNPVEATKRGKMESSTVWRHLDTHSKQANIPSCPP